jgi:GPH family glycoside/pentoside/hexuronide:cation symporter
VSSGARLAYTGVRAVAQLGRRRLPVRAAARAGKVSFTERMGYGLGDAAANFVFMTMVLFQTNFYTDVFGISAGAAALVLLVARAWDAVADPIVGLLSDRTHTRMGKFRPWILATALPWAVLMVLAYTTPRGLSGSGMIVYAFITNALLMSVYSMNNTPYAALGSVVTSDVDERTKLNTSRFILVNMAQFVVGGLTLPLVAKFSVGHDRRYGWQVTSAIWAAVCLTLFLFTVATTRERVSVAPRQRTSVKRDIVDLVRCGPWLAVIGITIVQFAMLSFRGAALYNYYHYYASRPDMYAFLNAVGLTSSSLLRLPPALMRLFGMLGYIVRGDVTAGSGSNVADVFNSIVNVTNTLVTVCVLAVCQPLSRRFGKKAVAGVSFCLAGASTMLFYAVPPQNVGTMLVFTVVICAFYAPSIPLIWAMYADVTDYCEWMTGRRFAGVAFATVGFSLKLGLALGSSAFLWIMVAAFRYTSGGHPAPEALEGFRFCGTLVTGTLLTLCALLVCTYGLDKRTTLRVADELVQRRRKDVA